MITIPHADPGPYLPGVGEVYRVDPSILGPVGRAPGHAVLVVRVPATRRGRITVVVRGPDLDRPDEAAGSWRHPTSVEATLWTPTMVRYRGTVDLAVLTAVRESFEL